MIVVGIADMKTTRNEGILITYALGSCIGICIYDPVIKLASMIHIMLPSSHAKVDNLYKYADTGITETIRKMEVFGAVRRRMYAKIAGGAKMFSIPGDSDFGSIGNKNINAVVEALKKEGILLKGKEVGGTEARTMLFNAENGEITIKTFGKPEKKM